MKFSFLTCGVTAFVSNSMISVVKGHGYMFEPPSRPYVASLTGSDYVTAPGTPKAEYCAWCLNQNTGVCGITQDGSTNYDDWLDSNGQPMPWTSQGLYQQGQIIDIEQTITAHHNGHIEMWACPLGRLCTMNDFKNNKLEFIDDVTTNMPKDENYPYRGMMSGADTFKMRFQLPNDLVGEQVLLQWWYFTANSCSPPGYSNYFARTDVPFKKWSPGIATCTPDKYPDAFFSGDTSVSERFLNCAEVTILPSDRSPLSEPVTAPPVVTPTNPPTGPPTIQPIICTPIPQEALPSGSYETNNVACGLCATTPSYVYWPCDTNPPLCRCGSEDDDSTPTDSVAANPTNAPSKASKSSEAPSSTSSEPSLGFVTPPATIISPTSTTDSPTTSPPVNSSPTTEGNNNGEEGCCSHDYKSCADWCNGNDRSQEQCETDPNCTGFLNDMKWLSEGDRSDYSCAARWEECTGDVDSCCNGLICHAFNQYYKQCLAFVPSPTTITTPTNNILSGPDCVPIAQDDLPPGTYATSEAFCDLCETGTHLWWPCDVVDPPICRCNDDISVRRRRRLGSSNQ